MPPVPKMICKTKKTIRTAVIDVGTLKSKFEVREGDFAEEEEG